MPNYLRIASRVFNRPLLVLPSTAETIGAFLLSRMAGHPEVDFPPERGPAASRFNGEGVGVGDPMEGTYVELYRRVGSTAVITVEGELVNRGAWIGASSGLTSYEGVAAQLSHAAEDPEVSSILLDIDSPGGEAVGAMEMAAVVRRVNRQKPVTALVNGMAASAAYAMASGAGRILTVPTGIVGSIGVVLLHLDRSAQLEKAGVAPTLVFAGAHKVDGHPFAALPAEVKADLQAEVDGFYSQFVTTVATGRQNLTEAAIRGTEARTYVGADAVRAGLADGVATMDELLANLLPRSEGQSPVLTEGSFMTTTTTPGADTAPAIPPELETIPGALIETPPPDAISAPAETYSIETASAVLELCSIAGAGASVASKMVTEKMTVDQARAFLAQQAADASNKVQLDSTRAQPASGSGWDEVTAEVNRRYGVGQK